jgi:hypothetical protein
MRGAIFGRAPEKEARSGAGRRPAVGLPADACPNRKLGRKGEALPHVSLRQFSWSVNKFQRLEARGAE